MKIRSPLARKRTRIEIIPLIDIMFFLLASFMMVSLHMQKVRTLKASLPTATLARSTVKPDIINLNVDSYGQVSLDNKQIPLPQLRAILTNRYNLNTNIPVYIAGAKGTKHGDIIHVLDFVRDTGIQKVAIAVKLESSDP
jgi:biopolymer transport protein ExbD